MHFCLETVVRTAVLTSMIATGIQAETTSNTLSAANPEPAAISVVRVDARTGRLIRRIIVPSKPGDRASQKPDPTITATVQAAAKDFDVSPELVDSVIQVESNYNQFAVSPKGAQGLMQLMPGTAKRFGVTNTFDARQNIEAGVRYLKFLQDTFKDDRLAIAAYNAGERAVAKYGDVPPYPETVNYVSKVGKKYGQAKRTAEQRKAQATTMEQPKPVEQRSEQEPRHVQGYLDAEGRLHIATR
jgi:soluble lytic murein transglycosylase-like protein